MSMHQHRGPWRHLRSIVWRKSVEDEVDSELSFHLEMRTRELMARGLSRDQARARGAREAGRRVAAGASLPRHW